MKQPNLCLYTKTWLSSGTGQIAQELAYALADQGVRVTFIAPEAQEARFCAAHPNLRRLKPPRERRDEAPKALRALVSLGRVIGSLAALFCARLSTRRFLVTIPDPLAFSLPALALLKLTGAKITYVVHDPTPHAWALPAWLRWMERLGHAGVIKIADQVVLLSEAGAAAVARLYDIPAKRISVIEHGVFDLGDAPPAPGRGDLLLYGTLRRNKGVMEAIEGVLGARARGAQVRLVIAGAPHAEDTIYWEACAALAAAHPEAIEVHAGYVTNEQTAALMRRTDAFLMPYRSFESQSGVAILAASNARPVIASAAGGIATLLAEGMAGVTIDEPVAAAKVTDAILAFFAQPLSARMAQANAYRNHMLATRSWPAIARAYRALMFGDAS